MDRSPRPPRRGRPVLAIVVLTALATVLPACQVARSGGRCTSGFARDATHVLSCQRGRWVRIGTVAEVARGLAQLSTPMVTLVGDSVARNLREPMGALLRQRGLRFSERAVEGCGVIEGSPAAPDGVPLPAVRLCGENVGRVQREIVAETRPDLVVVISGWEMQDRNAGGMWAPYGTPESDALILELYRQAVERLSATGARVVLVTMPDDIGVPSRAENPESTRRLRHLNGLLAEVERRDPGRVSVVRMDDIVCPTVDPCAPTVDGIVLRGADGVHFAEPAAADLVATRLVERLLAVPLGNGKQLPT